MTVDKDNEPVPGSRRMLFEWWRDQIAKLFGAALPKELATAGESGESDGPPFPVGQAARALQLTQQLIGPLYQGYLQASCSCRNPDSWARHSSRCRTRCAGSCRASRMRWARWRPASDPRRP